jgi:hypothetical protein
MIARRSGALGLQADDQLVVPVDVARRVRGDRRRGVRVDVVDPAPRSSTNIRCSCRQIRSVRSVGPARNSASAGVRRDVVVDEPADVDRLAPPVARQALPRCVHHDPSSCLFSSLAENRPTH